MDTHYVQLEMAKIRFEANNQLSIFLVNVARKLRGRV